MTNEELVNRIRNNDDKKNCLELLYLQNRGMIASVANKYSGFIEFDDLMQEGFFGLCKACEHWDECKGGSFINYANYWIVQSISRYVANNKSAVRIPENQGQLIQKFEKLTDEHIKKTSKAPSDRYLILHLGISARQLEQLKRDAQALKISSLETPVNNENESITLEDTIKDPTDQYALATDRIQNEQLAKEIWDIVNSLTPEQSAVIRERYQHNETIEGTAAKLQTDKKKVACLENKAIREMRKPKNKKRLEPYRMETSQIYSISLDFSGLGYFNRTWTSAPEKVVLMAEANK